MQITFMKDCRLPNGKIGTEPWPGEIVERMQNGARIRFAGKDGEQREYYVPSSDILGWA